jgi:hypothetical protein
MWHWASSLLLPADFGSRWCKQYFLKETLFMKQKNSRKLSLKKQTISRLTGTEMMKVQGGSVSIIVASAVCATDFTRPIYSIGCGSDFTRPGTIITR